MFTNWAIDGLDMTAWVVESGTVLRPALSVRGKTLAIPGQHGVKVIGSQTFEEPKVALVLSKQGDDATLAEADATLMQLLAKPSVTLKRTIGTETTTAAIRLETVTPEGGRNWIRYTILAAIPGVFFRGNAATTGSLWISGTMTTAALTNFPKSSAPVTDAILRITGEIGSVSVTDPISGTSISWIGTELNAPTKYLFIDCGNLTAWVSTASSTWTMNGTDVTSGLDYSATPLQIWQPNLNTVPTLTTLGKTISGTGATRALQINSRSAHF